MCPRPYYTDLTYMGDIEPCGPMKIIFCNHIKSKHTSINNFLVLVIWCEVDVSYVQDPSMLIWLIWELPDPVDQLR